MRTYINIHLPISTTERVLEQIEVMKINPEMTLRDAARFFYMTDQEAARDIIARVIEYHVQHGKGQFTLPLD